MKRKYTNEMGKTARKTCEDRDQMNSTKWRKWINYAGIPLLLLIFGLIGTNKGIDYTDTMYSLSNDILFPEAKSDWSLFMAYYLANFVGHLMTFLPFGNTFLGMRIYTMLVVYATGMSVYFYFGRKGKIPYWLLGLGEWIAFSFIWCPTTILYNFLTYLLLTVVLLLLRSGLLEKKISKLWIAGFLLGCNVFVRMPNITEVIFILAVFFCGILQKEKGKEIWKQVGACVLGFLMGFAFIFVAMEIKYGAGTYIHMVQSIFGMTDSATDYQSKNMLLTIFSYYWKVLPFFIGIIVAVLLGILFFSLLEKLKQKSFMELSTTENDQGRQAKNRKILINFLKILYFGCIAVLIRLFYARGLFGIDYNSDFAVIFLGALLLLATLVQCIVVMSKKHLEKELRLDACIVFLLILVTPLGSNNGVYTNLNNLFLIAPFFLYFAYVGLKEVHTDAVKYPVKAMMISFCVLFCVQGTLFHVNFTFKGADLGEKKDTKIENNDILKNMYTNKTRADALSQVLSEAEQYLEDTDRKLITYGNLPGMFYLLDASSVLSSVWPDLDSFSYSVFLEELTDLKYEIQNTRKNPLLILSSDVFNKEDKITDKEVLLKQFIEECGYEEVYRNEVFVILK